MSFAVGSAQGATASVNIIDFAFNPSSVSIQVNDSVVWTWVGPTVHTTTSTTGLWDSGIMNASASKFTHTFTASGSYPYICSIHPFMTGSVSVTGQVQTNVPPTVSITAPADGSSFPAPWIGTIQASVGDSDGSVTQVVFMVGSTTVGTISNPSATPSVTVSNLAAGSYTLTAVATDNVGASTTSTAVHIIVGTTNQPPATTNLAVGSVSLITFDPQTGLFDQTVTVTNASTNSAAGVRLSVMGLPGDVVLYDASGSTNGAPYVDYRQPLDPGASVAFLLEYYRSNRLDFVSTNFVAEAITPTSPTTPTGTLLQLDRPPFISNGELIIEFASKPGKAYVVEYSADMQTWNIAVPPITATGTRVQWTDTGPPKTASAPTTSAQRFYRVVQLP